jgi:LysR family hydrogen peroxide-inducible transcriptional activator
VLLAVPFACGDVEAAELFDDRLFLAFPGDEAPPEDERVDAGEIDERRLLLLEDGHCLKDHALAACNRPELRAGASMMGTSLHTLVQMVDNGLGLTFIPQMAIDAGILEGTKVSTRALASDRDSRRIALVWRRSSPREKEFKLLADSLSGLARELAPNLVPAAPEPLSPCA